jgi:hypothetical protein
MKDVLYGAQNLRQRFRVELRGSTRTGRQARQANLATARIFGIHKLLMLTTHSRLQHGRPIMICQVSCIHMAGPATGN